MIEQRAPRLASRTETGEQVAAWLTDRLGTRVDDVASAGAGAWSRAFGFSVDGAGYIVRFSALDEDFARDRYAARWNSPALPIPRVVELNPCLDGFYAISERAAGGFLDALDRGQMLALLPRLFALFDAMRTADTTDSTGYGGWNDQGNGTAAGWRTSLLEIERDAPDHRTHGWKTRLLADPERAAVFHDALTRMKTVLPSCPEPRQVIHGDLLNRNVLVEDGRLSAVIDWGCARYGDALYDLAWFAFWAPWFPRWDGIDFVAEFACHAAAVGYDLPNFAARLRCYQLHIGVDGMAYNAFQERWDQFAETARRTLEIIHGD